MRIAPGTHVSADRVHVSTDREVRSRQAWPLYRVGVPLTLAGPMERFSERVYDVPTF